MSFHTPWLLVGTLAALIPLLIHLFDRRRPRPHPFAAISFVLQSQRRTASRLRLRRLFLYLLRTLILLALPVALARPELVRPGGALRERGPAATALVLDASLSMQFVDGKSLFENGQAEARAAMRDLLPEEPATFLLCRPNASPAPEPGFDRTRLRALIDEAKPSYAAADLGHCLQAAARALASSPVANKRLVAISDFTAGSLRLDVPPPTVPGPGKEVVRPEVTLRDAAQGRAVLPNRAVVALKVEPAVGLGPRGFQFSFTVKNFSPEPVRDLEASLWVGDRVVTKGFVNVPAQGTAQKTLTHRFDAGGSFAGAVVLAPDSLAADDRWPFQLFVPKEIRALVVNGAPHAVRYRDEAFFVDAALGAPGSPVQLTALDAEAGFRERLEPYDVVLLLNVSAPPEDVVARLKAFVERGGGLFVSLGDNVVAGDYNQRLGGLLPRMFRDVRTAASRDEPGAEAKAARLTQVGFDEAVFAPFAGAAQEGLWGARFYRYMLLEPETGRAQTSKVLASFEDGAPALVEARREKGRVLLFTSTVDRDWSDFAIRTSFLPLMQRLCALLGGALDEKAEVPLTVGDTLTLRSGSHEAVARVQAPSGAELVPKVEAGGAARVGPLEEPGVWTAFSQEGRVIPQAGFAVQVDPAESDLGRLDPKELGRYFGEEKVLPVLAAGTTAEVPLWTWLIVLAVCAFFLEGVLLRK